jgi:hypothetical protein
LCSEETYTALRSSLIDRLSDKESPIRSVAVLALSKLIGTDDPAEPEEDENTILEVLLDALCFDPSAFVSFVLIIQSALMSEYQRSPTFSSSVCAPHTHDSPDHSDTYPGY